jgi:hypothetical protein
LSTNQETLADIDREAFRARYDEAVAEINIARRGLLTTEFYS